MSSKTNSDDTSFPTTRSATRTQNFYDNLDTTSNPELIPIPVPVDEENVTMKIWKEQMKDWTRNYEKIDSCRYSPAMVELLEENKNVNQNFVPEFDFVTVKKLGIGMHHKKYLVANKMIKAGEAFALLKGHVMRIYKEAETDITELIVKRPFPFVFFLNANISLCIDTRYMGNDIRFLRKSCRPNAEIQHYTNTLSMNFILVATKNISKDEEICIGFDFKWQKTDYEVSCTCDRAASNSGKCEVARFYLNKKKRTREEKLKDKLKDKNAAKQSPNPNENHDRISNNLDNNCENSNSSFGEKIDLTSENNRNNSGQSHIRQLINNNNNLHSPNARVTRSNMNTPDIETAEKLANYDNQNWVGFWK